MSLEHFQKTLFQEIIQGIALSCEGYLLEGKEMVDAAARIYLEITKEKETEETTLIGEWVEQREVTFRKLVTCTKCGKARAKFVGEELNYCQFCGRKIKANE